MFRHLGETEYRKSKVDTFKKIMLNLKQENISFGEPIFIGDGTRRRVEFTFEYKRGELILGFNARQTHQIVNIENCLLLTEQINNLLPTVRGFLIELCKISVTKKAKGSKLLALNIQSGQIFITQAANGIDICLETTQNPELDHRFLIAELVNQNQQILRFSWKNSKGLNEIIAQKSEPFITIAGHRIKIPSATFLQASEQSEKTLTDLVLKYAGETNGNVADLFCGIGTFSYPLANNIKNKITAIDASGELLDEFQKNINFLMIPNIKIQKRNLFKYPLEGDELKGFSLVVFDPPRAGAKEQVTAISKLGFEEKPQKIVAVSCNPHTFINDANILLSSGYEIKEITMVDQFNYSNHTELAALFEKK